MSLRGAINGKCRECTYDPKAGFGTWRQQVSACTVYGCALWPVRPIAERMPDGRTIPTTPDESRDWWRQFEASAEAGEEIPGCS